MNDLANVNIAMYITGSVASYKSIKMIRLLKQQGSNVKVIMSHGAQRFVTPLTFQAISGYPVILDQSMRVSSRGVLHVDLARWTDIALVMPATANVIAKAANGIADDIVSTCLLATLAPKVIVPAMNNVMFNNIATQRNLKRLSEDPDYYQFGPTYGSLAEKGHAGNGRMLEPQQVIGKLERFFTNRQRLNGWRVLVTAGGTREPIDPVRFITNGSSGKMGYAIAEQAQQMGAKVTLITGHAEIPAPKDVNIIRVKTTEDMEHAVLKQFPKNQALIMAAALADFEPAHPMNQKIKKIKTTNHKMVLDLKRTPDVLKHVARIKRAGQLTVGFAAETKCLIKNAVRKLKAKQLDLIVANDVANPKIGFGTGNNQVTFINSKGQTKRSPVESKRLVADQLLRIIVELKDDRS